MTHGREPRRAWPRFSFKTRTCWVTVNGLPVELGPGTYLTNRVAAEVFARRQRRAYPECEVKVWGGYSWHTGTL